MNLQFVVDGLLTGSMIGLGAIGVTLTYSILRFSNFAHGDFMAWGTYATLAVVGAIGATVGKVAPIAPLSFGWPLIVALLIGMALTGLLALLLDFVLFARLRAKGQAIIVVMASFGASMALRSLLEFTFTSRPTYFSRAIQIAMPVGFGIRITPDQIALLLLTAVLVLDEPSAGLSPKFVAMVFEMLAGIRKSGVTILLVEQNAKAALAIGDRAYVLVEGKDRHEGVASELWNDPVVAELYLGQRRKASEKGSAA